MKEKIRRVTGIILILVGVTMLASIAYKKIETKKKQQELQNILEQVINEEKPETTKEDGQSLESINGYKPIALMEIPSINLSQGIVEGIDDAALQYYLGHFEDSVGPGEKGNFSIAGHRVSDYSEAFVNLYKAEIGDEIIVKANKKEYIYKITKSFIVSPTDISVLEDTDNATITLVTCTVGAKERLIVKGDLIETRELNSVGSVEKQNE